MMRIMIAVVMGLCAWASAPLLATSVAQEPPESLLREMVSLINAKDVDGLLERLALDEQPCSAESQTATQPRPQCPAGVAPGTVVRTFLTANCSPFYVIGSDGARKALEERLGAAQEVTVVQVFEGRVSSHPQVRYVAISTARGSVEVDGYLWYLTDDLRLAGIVSTCSLSVRESIDSHISIGLAAWLRPSALASAGLPRQTTDRLVPILNVLILSGVVFVCAGVALRHRRAPLT